MLIHLFSVLKIDICVLNILETPKCYAYHSFGFSTLFFKVAYVNVLKNLKLSIKITISIPTKNNRQCAAKKLRKYHV